MKNQLFKLTILAIGLMLTHSLFAQEFKFNMSGGTLRITEVNEVTILGSTGNEVTITTEKALKIPERAKGLRSINGSGLIDNTNLGLALSDAEGGKEIQQVTRNSVGRYRISVPSTIKVIITHSSNQGGEIRIEGYKGEVEADTRYSSLRLRDVTGPTVLNTIYGKIEAEFTNISNKDISLVSIYGSIDVTLPTTAKATLELKSGHGDIFTDLDIKFDESEGMKSLKSSRIKGTINGGGTNMFIEAKYDNIYLRKK